MSDIDKVARAIVLCPEAHRRVLQMLTEIIMAKAERHELTAAQAIAVAQKLFGELGARIRELAVHCGHADEGRPN